MEVPIDLHQEVELPTPRIALAAGRRPVDDVDELRLATEAPAGLLADLAAERFKETLTGSTWPPTMSQVPGRSRRCDPRRCTNSRWSPSTMRAPTTGRHPSAIAAAAAAKASRSGGASPLTGSSGIFIWRRMGTVSRRRHGPAGSSP